MGGALLAEVLVGERGARHDLAAVGVLAVEGAQRVDLRTLAALVAHLVRVVEDELADLLAIGGTARGVAHRVDGEVEVSGVDAESLVEVHQHDDGLGVSRRIGGAQPLDAHLVELAETALLRALAAEHRLRVPQLHGSAALRDEVVLDGGANDARRALGAHGEALLGLEATLVAGPEDAVEQGAGEDAEHLLAHDVRRLADAMHERGDLLHRRRLDSAETIGLERLAGRLLHVLPGTHARTEQVLGALCLVRHRGILSLVGLTG